MARAAAADPAGALGPEPPLASFAGRFVEAAVLVAALGAPLLVDGENARRFEPQKVVLVRSAVLAALLALGWRAVELWGAGRATSARDRLRRASREPLALAALLLVFAWTASTVCALSPRTSAWGSFARLQGLYSLVSYAALALCVAACVRRRERIERLIDALVLSSIPIGLLGIAQRYGLDPLALMPDPRRVASTLGAPNFAGAYVTLVLPLTLVRLVGSLTADSDGERRARAPAAYGFALAAQVLLSAFAQSRGPMLGALAAGFIVGLLLLLDASVRARGGARHTRAELVRAYAALPRIAVASALAALLGGGAGVLLERALAGADEPLTGLAALGLGAGAALGFALAFAHGMRDAAARRSAWMTWIAAAALALLGLGALNLRGTALDPLLEPLRSVALLGRLAKMGSTESGTVQVRLAIWEAALELGERPIGIAGSALAPPDPRHALRPWLGYGPDSLYTIFPSVAPPALAHLEGRGSSADRAHNETIDALVTTGRIGAIATYLLWAALIARCLTLLGFLRDRRAGCELFVAVSGLGLGGAVLARLIGPGWALVPLGLPLGMLAGVVAHVARRGYAGRVTPPAEVPLVAIGLFGLACGTWIQSNFLFPTSPVHVVTWIAVGLLVALHAEREARASRSAVASAFPTALLAAFLCFAFVRTPGAQLASTAGLVLLVVLALTALAGFALAPAGARGREHALAAALGCSVALLPVVSARVFLDAASDAEAMLRRAGALSRELGLFAAWLAAFALAFAWAQRGALASGPRSKPLARAALAPLALIVAWLFWRENAATALAGVHLELGDRLAQRGDFRGAVVLHERARALDPDEPRCALAAARDQQALAADPQLAGSERERAYELAAAAALEARRLEPYDVDGSANLGRLEHSRASAGEPARFAAALARFDEAVALAPNDPELELLAARTLLDAGDAAGAVPRIERALAIDGEYAASWLLSGDARLALGEIDAALDAHLAALRIAARGNDGAASFSAEGFDARLSAYADPRVLERWLAGLDAIAAARPADFRLPWIAARTLLRAGETERAIAALERAAAGGYAPVLLELADARLGAGDVARAEEIYRRLSELELDASVDSPARRGLARALVARGRYDEALDAMLELVRRRPEDELARAELDELRLRLYASPTAARPGTASDARR